MGDREKFAETLDTFDRVLGKCKTLLRTKGCELGDSPSLEEIYGAMKTIPDSVYVYMWYIYDLDSTDNVRRWKVKEADNPEVVYEPSGVLARAGGHLVIIRIPVVTTETKFMLYENDEFQYNFWLFPEDRFYRLCRNPRITEISFVEDVYEYTGSVDVEKYRNRIYSTTSDRTNTVTVKGHNLTAVAGSLDPQSKSDTEVVFRHSFHGGFTIANMEDGMVDEWFTIYAPTPYVW